GWTTAGALAGFTAPAVVGASTAAWPTAAFTAALIAAGAVEGAVLGAAQVRVLRRVWPRLGGLRWTAATGGGAAVAWFLGLLPAALHDTVSRRPVLVAAAAALLVPALLLSVGTAQWWVLRAHAERAHRWIAGSAAGWLLGLAVFFAITTPLWRPGQSAPVAALIGVAGGAAMAVTAAAVTGWVLVRLAREAAQKARPPAAPPGAPDP
ncbi:hypothetical protein ACLIYP_27715, partial [Streptomyces nanhaiensis]